MNYKSFKSYGVHWLPTAINQFGDSLSDSNELCSQQQDEKDAATGSSRAACADTTEQLNFIHAARTPERRL